MVVCEVRPGEEVTVTGHPARFEWMRALVGRKGTVEEVRDLSDGESQAARLSGLPFGDCWIGAAYLEPAGQAEEGEVEDERNGRFVKVAKKANRALEGR